MALQDRAHRQTADLVAAAGLEDDELDRRPELAKSTGKQGSDCCRSNASRITLWQPWMPNDVARDIGRREERKAHDVVPMEMGHEDVVAALALRPLLAQHVDAELARARAKVAQRVLVAGAVDLDAARIAAVGAGDRKGQLVVDEAVDGFGPVEAAALSGEQAGAQLVAHRALARAAPAASRVFPRTESA